MNNTDDWAQTTVGEVIDHFGGNITTGPFGTLLKASEYTDDGVPLISVGEIRNGFIAIKENTPRVDHSITSRMPQYLLREGDIVFGRKGAVERSARISASQSGWFLGSDGIAVRLPDTKCDTRFISYLLQDNAHAQWIVRHALGSTMLSLNQQVIRRIPLRLPPLPEQQKIAAILSTWDRAIELTEKLIAAKQKRKQALMQQLLTGKVRFKEFGKSKEWTTTMLGNVVSLSSGGTPSKANPEYWDGKIPWVTAKDLKRLHLTDSIDHVREHAIGNGTRLMPTGTIFVLVRGMTLLKDVPICIASTPMCFNQDIRALTIKKDYDYRFIAYSLVASKQRLLSLVNVAGHGTGRLATEFLVEFPIKVPLTAEEQSAVADVIDAADREITLLRSRGDHFQTQKKGLMQQLLSGKVRVMVKTNESDEALQ